MAKEIESPHLILCEGIDDELFLTAYLKALGNQDARFRGFQPINTGGKDNTASYLELHSKLGHLAAVRSITIVRDADAHPDRASRSVQTVFRNVVLAIPHAPCTVAIPGEGVPKIKTGYVLFPGLDSLEQNGTLEDLCLKLLKPERDGVLEIAEDAVARREREIGTLRRPHKNRLHTYLSLTDKYVGQKIGVCSEANAFDFSAEALAPLKDLLCAMLDESA
jgi:hypothetical protein